MTTQTIANVLASARRLIRRRVYPTVIAVRDELQGQHCSFVISRALKELRESGQLTIPANLPRPLLSRTSTRRGLTDPDVIKARAARVQCAGRLLGRSLESKELYRVLPK